MITQREMFRFNRVVIFTSIIDHSIGKPYVSLIHQICCQAIIVKFWVGFGVDWRHLKQSCLVCWVAWKLWNLMGLCDPSDWSPMNTYNQLDTFFKYVILFGLAGRRTHLCFLKYSINNWVFTNIHLEGSGMPKKELRLSCTNLRLSSATCAAT